MDKAYALIVEDDRDIAALFRHVLDIAGYRTEVAMDGRDAVERLRLGRPDIVLLDLTLPGIPGPKILELMRADERLAHIPVVVVTGQAHIADSLAVEPDLVLLKPVNLNQLSNLVQRLRRTDPITHPAPWDALTHLYNRGFFTIRLGYSLERSKQIGKNRFGVVFTDVTPFAELRAAIARDQLDIFLREIAGHLKTNLRPTDTVARFDEGLFLALIEDLPDYLEPPSIPMRIEADLATLVRLKKLVDGLRVNVGMVVCDGRYASVEEIVGDIDIARKLVAEGNAQMQYERTTLARLRTGSA